MATKFKLTKSIRNVADNADVSELDIKSEDDFTASDFYDVEVPTDGKIKMGIFAPGIANIAGITESQVASLCIKDYTALSEIVGKHIL